MKFVNVHMRATRNVGDLNCAPGLYYPLGDIRCLTQIPSDRSDSILVIGGGGLFNDNFQWWVTAHMSRYRMSVVWGVGTNTANIEAAVYPAWLAGCTLTGCRDSGSPFVWVPCASCKHPLFQAHYEVCREVAVYRHAEMDTIPGDIVAKHEGLTNFATLEQVIPFLGSAEIVVTNTYHGMYWATLLGKRVVVYPYANRFHHFAFPPALAQPGDNWSDLVSRTQSYPEAIGTCTEANDSFYDVVTRVFK